MAFVTIQHHFSSVEWDKNLRQREIRDLEIENALATFQLIVYKFRRTVTLFDDKRSSYMCTVVECNFSERPDVTKSSRFEFTALVRVQGPQNDLSVEMKTLDKKIVATAVLDLASKKFHDIKLRTPVDVPVDNDIREAMRLSIEDFVATLNSDETSAK